MKLHHSSTYPARMHRVMPTKASLSKDVSSVNWRAFRATCNVRFLYGWAASYWLDLDPSRFLL